MCPALKQTVWVDWYLFMLFLKLDELSLRHQRIIIDTGDHVGYTDKAIYNWKGMRN